MFWASLKHWVVVRVSPYTHAQWFRCRRVFVEESRRCQGNTHAGIGNPDFSIVLHSLDVDNASIMMVASSNAFDLFHA